MTVITAPTPQPAPMSPPARRRPLWAALAFTLGAISGAGITLAVDDDASSGADVGAVVSDVERHPTAGVGSTPPGSADALERAVQHRQQTKAADCTRLPTSADAADRCLSAGR
jgi:hypothetical protein